MKSVKKLSKEILLAILLGILLPTLTLRLLVGKEGNAEITEETDQSVQETMPLFQHDAVVTIPVLTAQGIVREMDLENYLCGVVLAEMPTDFEMEALKAQSVVARTYALRRWESGTKHPSGAVCTDPACCQGYMTEESYYSGGGNGNGVRRVRQAVLETAGEVVVYDGTLIDATYFSCSGGRTEDALAVWGADIPYLQATDSPGEEQALYYTDTAVYTREELERRLGITLSEEPGEWFSGLTRTRGGGVARISVGGTEFTGVQIRKLLGLRSTDFTVTVESAGIVFETHGYGHRVGLSQYGAEAMAVQGKQYDEILAHYYVGTSLVSYDTKVDKPESGV